MVPDWSHAPHGDCLAPDTQNIHSTSSLPSTISQYSSLSLSQYSSLLSDSPLGFAYQPVCVPQKTFGGCLSGFHRGRELRSRRCSSFAASACFHGRVLSPAITSSQVQNVLHSLFSRSLLATLLGPLVVGSSVKALVGRRRPRRSVIGVHRVFIDDIKK